MSAIDVAALLNPISDDAPCGENLEYDPAMGELERSAQGKPEQQFGDTIIPAEEPDWEEVKRNAVAVLEQTHDLRVIPYLARAITRTDGFAGFCDALSLLHGFLEQFWETVYPQLDPDDDNDPTFRVNAVAALTDGASMLSLIRTAPLVSSRALGRFSLRDIDIAQGHAQAPAGEDAPDLALIEGAFQEAAAEELQATAEAIQRAVENVTAIESLLSSAVGSDAALDMAPLMDVLKDAQRTVNERLERRGESTVGEDDTASAPDAGEAEAGGALAAAPARGISGDIAGREDVVKMLDKINAYYDKHEPSSPVPMLLRRAKRLVYMDFLQIVQDLVPDGWSQAEAFKGPEE